MSRRRRAASLGTLRPRAVASPGRVGSPPSPRLLSGETFSVPPYAPISTHLYAPLRTPYTPLPLEVAPYPVPRSSHPIGASREAHAPCAAHSALAFTSFLFTVHYCELRAPFWLSVCLRLSVCLSVCARAAVLLCVCVSFVHCAVSACFVSRGDVRCEWRVASSVVRRPSAWMAGSISAVRCVCGGEMPHRAPGGSCRVSSTVGSCQYGKCVLQADRVMFNGGWVKYKEV